MNKRKKHRVPPVAIKVVGHVLSESYQRCRLFAEKLKKYYGDDLKEVVVQGLLEADWTEYLQGLRRTVGGQTWAAGGGAVAFVDGAHVGADRELAARFEPVVFETPGRGALEKLARAEYLSRLNRGDRLYVYFELTAGGDRCGSLLFELRHDLLPDTAAWFARLSEPGDALGFGYRGSRIHRVCRGGWLQGGDVGGRSHAALLPDESLCCKHDRRGVLSFVNGGRHSNCTAYAVTFGPAAWMDGRFVAFGRVVEGSAALRRLEGERCTHEAPDRPIVVERCGVAEVGLGRHFAARRPLMRGLTQGDPHVEPAALADLLFDGLSAALRERSPDGEAERPLAAALWDRLEAALAGRLPPPDALDPGDRPSALGAARYLAGLYGPPDVPDRFVRRLPDRAVARALDPRVSAEVVAEYVVRRLTDDAVGPGESLCASMGPGETPPLSTSPTLDTRKRVKFVREPTASSDAPDALPAVGYVWEALFDSLKPASD